MHSFPPHSLFETCFAYCFRFYFIFYADVPDENHVQNNGFDVSLALTNLIKLIDPFTDTISRRERARFPVNPPKKPSWSVANNIIAKCASTSNESLDGPKAIPRGRPNPSQNPRHRHLAHSLSQKSSTRDSVPASETCHPDTTLTSPSVPWPRPSKDGT